MRREVPLPIVCVMLARQSVAGRGGYVLAWRYILAGMGRAGQGGNMLLLELDVAGRGGRSRVATEARAGS